ncbi:MAG: hypothetical protein ICV83_18820 [Cytophagales bacterium]|nr:hypothetical protein [Cytophagales bacterium]
MDKPLTTTTSLLFILFALVTCKDKLPKPTQEGKNTFACKVNGSTFVAVDSGGLFGVKGVFAAYVSAGDYIVVHGSRQDDTSDKNFKEKKDILLYIRGIQGKGVGAYELNQFRGNNGPESYAQYDVETLFPGTHYYTVSPGAGQVHLTKLDTIQGIISGTFEFKAVNPKDTTQVVRITNGRFDISTRRR